MRLRGRSRGKGAGRKSALDPELKCARFVLFAKFFFCSTSGAVVGLLRDDG
jgi:hypothetical protein